MNKEAEQFIEAVKKNARLVWDEPDDEDFVNELLFVQEKDGVVTISDNYEKFFQTMYRITSDGKWWCRSMWSESVEWREYSFSKAMGDASIMYTG